MINIQRYIDAETEETQWKFMFLITIEMYSNILEKLNIVSGENNNSRLLV